MNPDMIKDMFFKPSRFMDVCRKDIVENWKSNLLRIAMMYGIMTVILVGLGFINYGYTSGHDSVLEIGTNSFYWFLWIFGLLSASLTMEKMKSKTKRLAILMNPATTFEKFISRWMISTVVYFFLFIILFLLADYTRFVVCSIIFPDTTILPFNLKYVFRVSNDSYYVFSDPKILNIVIMGYLFFQSLFILGSTIWAKNSFIKTFTAGFLIFLSYVFIGWVMVNISGLKDMYFNVPQGANEFMKNNHMLVFNLIAIFFILINWILAYFRFKETEIINRM